MSKMTIIYDYDEDTVTATTADTSEPFNARNWSLAVQTPMGGMIKTESDNFSKEWRRVNRRSAS